jgi:uncharacterized protein YcbK (DUF882 family)
MQTQWGVSAPLADRIAATKWDFEMEYNNGLEIISGARTIAQQNALRLRGRPTAPNDRSTHLTCPATGADIQILGLVSVDMKQSFVRMAQANGLRVGGGSAIDKNGIPDDWNHVDLGPR